MESSSLRRRRRACRGSSAGSERGDKATGEVYFRFSCSQMRKTPVMGDKVVDWCADMTQNENAPQPVLHGFSLWR